MNNTATRVFVLVEYGDVEWFVYRVEYDSAELADSINPAHSDAVRWQTLELSTDGDSSTVDLTPFLNDKTLNAIEDKLKEYFRNGG